MFGGLTFCLCGGSAFVLLFVASAAAQNILPPTLASNLDALCDLYLSTNGPDWKCRQEVDKTVVECVGWTGCSRAAGQATGSFTALTDPCDGAWFGVETCAEISGSRHVTAIDLHNVSITGALPESIGDLAGILSLDLRDNKLTGTIPQSIMELAGSVAKLALDGNPFETGTMPVHIFKSERDGVHVRGHR